jgi:RNase P subunit RPR2
MVTIKQTYCTTCKTNVDIIDGKYVRLANNRAVFGGQCSQCGTKLTKARVMPRSSAIIVKRKRKSLLS